MTSVRGGDLIGPLRADRRMIASLSLILLCQLAGEVFVRGLGLPLPGPVVGLLLLLLLLLARDRFVLLARGPLQGDGVETLIATMTGTLMALPRREPATQHDNPHARA